MNTYKTKVLLISFFLILTGFFASTSFAWGQAKQVVSDSAITAAVKTKLISDPVTSSSGISVETTNGVVTLTGNVKTNQEVDEAVENAESVNGVSDVNSNIVVAGSTQPVMDTIITAKVKGTYIRENLFANNEVSLTDIHVETKDGVVYLSGKAIKEQADNAEKLAKTVNGVKRVVSNIKILQEQ